MNQEKSVQETVDPDHGHPTYTKRRVRKNELAALDAPEAIDMKDTVMFCDDLIEDGRQGGLFCTEL